MSAKTVSPGDRPGPLPVSSARADAGEIIDRLRGAPPPDATYLVHGGPTGPRARRDRIDGIDRIDRIDRELGWTAAVPHSGERVLVR